MNPSSAIQLIEQFGHCLPEGQGHCAEAAPRNRGAHRVVRRVAVGHLGAFALHSMPASPMFPDRNPQHAGKNAMTAVTKAAFVVSLAKTHGITRQAAQEVANAVIATLAQTLIDSYDITPPRLGGFSRKERVGRTGRNPVTGESLEIPARRAIQFKVASDLQRQIRQPE